MALSRRTFLRVLGSAAAVAVASPLIPDLDFNLEDLTSPLSPTVDVDIVSAMKETYRILTQQTGCQPNVMIVGREVFQTMARQCGLVFDLELLETDEDDPSDATT